MNIKKLFLGRGYEFSPIVYHNKKYVIKIEEADDWVLRTTGMRYTIYEYEDNNKKHRGKKIFSDSSRALPIILTVNEQQHNINCTWDMLVESWYFKEFIKKVFDLYYSESQKKREWNEKIKCRKEWDGVINQEERSLEFIDKDYEKYKI